MDEEVGFGLEHVAAAFEERDVLRRHRPRHVAVVAAIGRVAAEQQPVLDDVLVAFADVQQHLVVVAQDRHQSALLRQCDQPVDHPGAVRPAIDEVAEHDQGVVGLRADGRQQPVQGGRVAVDVADGNRAAGRP